MGYRFTHNPPNSKGDIHWSATKHDKNTAPVVAGYGYYSPKAGIVFGMRVFVRGRWRDAKGGKLADAAKHYCQGVSIVTAPAEVKETGTIKAKWKEGGAEQGRGEFSDLKQALKWARLYAENADNRAIDIIVTRDKNVELTYEVNQK